MSEKPERDLTTLEYIVLGLIGLQPQSGYSIVSYFESESSSWSASPGSIYPMLKRLEKQAIIEGELEMTYETRPRKVYTLTEKGVGLLDGWLAQPPKLMPFFQEREIAMWRFLFMEGRMEQSAIRAWLENYLKMVEEADTDALFKSSANGDASLHRQLAAESSVMALNALRAWLETAIARFESV